MRRRRRDYGEIDRDCIIWAGDSFRVSVSNAICDKKDSGTEAYTHSTVMSIAYAHAKEGSPDLKSRAKPVTLM